MIKSCNFGAGGGSSACQNLIQNKAETVFAPGTGVCYIFNFGLILSQQPNFGSNLNRSEVLMADSAYSSGGLKLEIDIECNFGWLSLTRQKLTRNRQKLDFFKLDSF